LTPKTVTCYDRGMTTDTGQFWIETDADGNEVLIPKSTPEETAAYTQWILSGQAADEMAVLNHLLGTRVDDDPK
jgi:hypothetical protein